MMELYEHEVLSLIMGLAVCCIILRSREAFRGVPGYRLLFAGFLTSLSAWGFSLLDHFPALHHMALAERMLQSLSRCPARPLDLALHPAQEEGGAQ